MHSFLRLVETLAADGDEGPFLLSTVDTVAGAQTYARFIAEARRLEQAAVTLALTSPGNDESRCSCELRREIHASSRSVKQRRPLNTRRQECTRFAHRFSAKPKRPGAKGSMRCELFWGACSIVATTLRAFQSRNRSMSIVPRISGRRKNFSGARRYETAARIVSGKAILARPSSIERCAAARSDCASAAGARFRGRSPHPRRSQQPPVGRGDRFFDVPGKIGARKTGGVGAGRRQNYQQPAVRVEHSSRSAAGLDGQSRCFVSANPSGRHQGKR